MVGTKTRAKVGVALALLGLCGLLRAEVQVVDGVRYECVDGVCRMVDGETEPSRPEARPAGPRPRIAQGYMSAAAFVRWLEGGETSDAAGGPLAEPGGAVFGVGILLVILLGGLALNLTPCVLPMIPVNLLVIGRSAARGAWYGLGIALAYGALGVAAAVGGLAFGTIQGNPWFNLAVAALFLVLAAALGGSFALDFSRGRTVFASRRATMLPNLFAFVMGGVSAVLAGACVAPILIAVLLLTGKLYAEGRVAALALPFVLGLGMALPWPFLGAGLRVFPRPGAWMKWVNRGFAALLLCLAGWYGRLAYTGFVGTEPEDGPAEAIRATPETFAATYEGLTRESGRPVLVDCWATWCKNCAAMDRVLATPEVRRALAPYRLVRLQAEDMTKLRRLPGFESVRGLPAFVVFAGADPRPTESASGERIR